MLTQRGAGGSGLTQEGCNGEHRERASRHSPRRCGAFLMFNVTQTNTPFLLAVLIRNNFSSTNCRPSAAQ